MDSTSRLITILKSLPLWVLAALAAVSVVSLACVPLQAEIPNTLRPSLPVITLLLVSLTLFGGLAHIVADRQARQAIRKQDDRLRLERIYGPLAALFLQRHVTTCTGILAPKLKHRLANAWSELTAYRRLSSGVRRGIRAMFDRQASTSAEVEYGGDFPLTEIRERIVAEPMLAGPELLHLVRRADRSHYEDAPSPGLLTDEEYALFVYIHAQHGRLTRR